MRNRISIVIVLSVFAVVGSLIPRGATNAISKSDPQDVRRRQTKRIKQPPNQRKPVRDYSNFSHRSDKHKSLVCSACHKAPTANWPTASAFPDVSDYPAHEACLGCHRNEFFKGARPVICSICHTKVSPRGKERFAFEKPDQPSQFTTIFPHDKHQDVIAANKFDQGVESAHAIRRIAFVQDKPRADYNNCTICHETETRALSPQDGFPDNFQPAAGTFKAAPVGHASCFNCHWKNQEPMRESCAGCHSLSQTDVAIILAPTRKSLKFKHEREQHLAECTVCHINITGVSSLVGLKPDVPITSCSDSSCHGASLDNKKVTIETESDNRTRDPSFVCTKCHTSDVGKRAAPASHRASLTQ